jgi:hypothetical protein
MNENDWKELIEDYPGSDNHGRRRGQDGGWIPLEIEETDENKSFKRYVDTSAAALARTVRYLISEGYSVADVAALTGVTVRHIQRIVPGRPKGRPKSDI